MDAVIKTTCPYCGVGCGLSVTVRAGQITAVRGDKTHPSSLGGICPKGAQIDEIINTPNRLTAAQIRPDRSSGFQPVSLDAALKHVADEFRDIIRHHGRDAVAF
jgi:anaerobic selenocysteine-containing dehydrogenase